MNVGQRGFTLLEVLIAISIFALLGMATYRMLDSVLRADEATRANEQSLRELSRTFAALDRDLAQAAARSVRDPYGDQRAALLGELGAVDGSAAIELTRNGWHNPMGLARAQLQRVRWRLADKTLERVYWAVLDQAVDSQPRVQSLLEGVRSLEFRYLDERGEWQGQWPPATGDLTPEENRLRLPMAVELKLEHERYGELTRLYRLPDPLVEEQQQAPPETPPAPSEPAPTPTQKSSEPVAPVQEAKA